jgi:hypothetical protein
MFGFVLASVSAALVVIAQEPTSTAAITATRIGQHQIGESLQRWIAVSHELDNIDAVCNSKSRGIQKKIEKSNCERLRRIQSGQQNEIETHDESRSFTWVLVNGKLSAVEIDIPGPLTLKSNRPDIDQEFSFLVQTYGKPTGVETVPYQNAYSAHWDCTRMTWTMPDGVRIVANEHMLNSAYEGPQRQLMVVIASKEAIAVSSQYQKEHQEPNPYR